MNRIFVPALVILCLSLLFAGADCVSAQQVAFSPEPMDFVGEWSGEVRAPGSGIYTSRYYLTIDEVKGGKFRGRLLVMPSRVFKTEEVIEGTFDGGILEFTAPSGRKAKLLFESEKKRFVGKGFGTVEFDITLSKKG